MTGPATGISETAPNMSTRTTSRPNPSGPRSSAETVRRPIAELPTVRPVRDSQIHMDSMNANDTAPAIR